MTIRYILCEIILVALAVVCVSIAVTHYNTRGVSTTSIISDPVAAHSAIASDLRGV